MLQLLYPDIFTTSKNLWSSLSNSFYMKIYICEKPTALVGSILKDFFEKLVRSEEEVAFSWLEGYAEKLLLCLKVAIN